LCSSKTRKKLSLPEITPLGEPSVKDFLFSFFNKGSIKIWKRDDINGVIALFADSFALFVLLVGLLPAIWSLQFIPAWYFSALTGIYVAPVNLIGVINFSGTQIPVIIPQGYSLLPDFQIFYPHKPWGVISALLGACALQVLIGNFAYSYYAYKKTMETGKTYTALPFGISAPGLFLFLGVIIGLSQTTLGFDLYTAVSIAILANILSSIIEIIIAFGLIEHIKRHIPTAGVLGTIAGIGFAWLILNYLGYIAGGPVNGVNGALNGWPYLSPTIGFVVLFILLAGIISRLRIFKKIPTNLLAIIVGSTLVVINILWLGHGTLLGDPFFYFREMWAQIWGGVGPQFSLALVFGQDITKFVYPQTFTFMFPGLRPELLSRGFQALPMIIAVIVPFQIYDSLESYANNKSGNLEMARKFGIEDPELLQLWCDEYGYSAKTTMLIDGCSSLLGTPFGSWAPTVNYEGSASYVRMGAGIGYSVLHGIITAAIVWCGILFLVPMVIPTNVTVPILLVIGGLIVVQAFKEVYEENKKMNSPDFVVWGDLFAVMLAMIPHFFTVIALTIINNFKNAYTGALMSTATTPYQLYFMTINIAGIPIQIPLAQSLGLYGYVVNETFSYASATFGWYGIVFLGLGATTVGLIWGSITSDLNHRFFRRAFIFAAIAALLALIGIIHAYSIPTSFEQLVLQTPWALAYLAAAIYILILWWKTKSSPDQKLTKH
jgi:AGZA family xanthine/uracil permease-like MFS transporter